jgi:SAM-dependent methyltransferase
MVNESTTTPACKLCGSNWITKLYTSQRYTFKVGRCRQCGLTFVLDQIGLAALKEMYSDEEDFLGFTNAVSNEKVWRRHDKVLCEIRQWLEMSERVPRLLDVGAGSGHFLNRARQSGFEIYGTELSEAAVAFAHQRYDITLSLQPLEQDPRTAFFDVITMWGLIEHVLDPLSMLKQAFRLLRSGGILYIYTPVRCLYDDTGLWLARLSRWTQLLDRRITLAHLQLFSVSTIHKILTAIGLEMLKADTVCEYNLPTSAYLQSLGVPSWGSNTMAALLNQLIDRGLFFRNNIRVFCRKP